MTQDKDQLTDNIVYFVSHVGDDSSEEDNEGADIAGRMSHSEGTEGYWDCTCLC